MQFLTDEQINAAIVEHFKCAKITAKWAVRYYRRPHDFDELHSECLEAMLESAKAWDPNGGASIKTWMINKMRFRCHSVCRSKWNKETKYPEVPLLSTSPDGQFTREIDPRPKSSASAREREWKLELGRRVWHFAVQNLGTKDLGVFLRFWSQGMNLSEIAEADGLSRERISQIAGAVRKRLLVLLATSPDLQLFTKGKIRAFEQHVYRKTCGVGCFSVDGQCLCDPPGLGPGRYQHRDRTDLCGPLSPLAALAAAGPTLGIGESGMAIRPFGKTVLEIDGQRRRRGPQTTADRRDLYLERRKKQKSR